MEGVANLEKNFKRILPTPCRPDYPDDSVAAITNGKSNYVLGADGVVRAVERVGGRWRVTTVTRGVPDAYDQENWTPGRPIRLSPTQRNAIRMYKMNKIGFDEAMKRGGLNVN